MAGIPFPPLLWEPSLSSHAPTPRQTPVPDGDDLRVSRPLLLRSLPRYYISVVGDSCPEISFSEANRKEDNGMNDFRVIQKQVLGKMRHTARRWDTFVRVMDTQRKLCSLGRAACDPSWVWTVTLRKAHALVTRFEEVLRNLPCPAESRGRCMSSDPLKSGVRVGKCTVNTYTQKLHYHCYR